MHFKNKGKLKFSSRYLAYTTPLSK